MSKHKEIAFEEEICEYLGSHGWVYVEGDSSNYDRARALFLNGIPVATAELKTDFTQSVKDAIE